LNNTAVTVVGVLPDTFDFGSVFSPGAKVDLFTPYIMDDFRDDGNDLALIGRLKPGVTLAQAQREADQLFPQLYFEHKHPEYGKGYTGQLTELKEHVSGKLRRSLVVPWCAIGLILLMVCVNLSNLLLARAAARSKEFAMRRFGDRRRTAGASIAHGKPRVVGSGSNPGIGTWLRRYLLPCAPGIYRVAAAEHGARGRSGAGLDAVDSSWRGCSFWPGTRPAHIERQPAGNIEGQRTGSQRKQKTRPNALDRMRSALVITEVALAWVLLVGAGLLLRSFLRVLDVDLGFEPSRAAAISVDYDKRIPMHLRYPSLASRNARICSRLIFSPACMLIQQSLA